MSDSTIEQLREAGRRVRAEYFGPASLEVDRPVSDTLAPDLGPLSDDANWGRIWARDGLDLKTKSLCIVAALLALERYPYARSHMYGARNIGVTLEELTAAIVQLTFYAGLPVVHNGLAIAAEVYADPEPRAANVSAPTGPLRT